MTGNRRWPVVSCVHADADGDASRCECSRSIDEVKGGSAVEDVDVPELLTARQVSDMTRISVATLHDWAVKRENGLRACGPAHHRLGHQRRWSKADVLAWLASTRVE